MPPNYDAVAAALRARGWTVSPEGAARLVQAVNRLVEARENNERNTKTA